MVRDKSSFLNRLSYVESGQKSVQLVRERKTSLLSDKDTARKDTKQIKRQLNTDLDKINDKFNKDLELYARNEHKKKDY